MSQIVLPWGQLGGGQQRIVVGAANAEVIDLLGHSANWPFRTMVLLGPPRSGKSLLARWFAEQGWGEAIDDADREAEDALFHRWNAAQAGARALLLTASLPADGRGWVIALPDLASRLGAAIHAELAEPDDAMFAELLLAHAEVRGLALVEEAARYLASRATRSHLEAERLVETIDRLSLERKSAPGPAIWREALEHLHGAQQPRLL
mgnify:FL=1